MRRHKGELEQVRYEGYAITPVEATIIEGTLDTRTIFTASLGDAIERCRYGFQTEAKRSI